LKAVFADTSFWIALLNPKDELHVKARELAMKLADAQVVTTEMVLAELLNDFGRRGRMLRLAAKRLVDELVHNENLTIVPQTSKQFQSALALYGDRADKNWGLTDCASFLVMQAMGLTEALTYDKHFEQVGFQALLR
jgi:predicted nucleic acid-binding protein